MEHQVTWFFSIVAAIMLFLHGLAAFSSELTNIGGDRLKLVLQKLTQTDIRAAMLGSFTTSLVQSSSAITSIAVGLSDKRSLSLRGAFAIMIGANVGTTLTSWLVAMKIPGLGPVFITIGGAWSLIGYRPYRAYGKAVFYFGLIFLALDLIADSLMPLSHSSALFSWHEWLKSPFIALLAGFLLTVIVQSSSVVSGIAVVVVSQAMISPNVAIWMVAGANVGTTSTALLASSALGKVARRMALMNTAFNIFGVLLFASLLQPLIHWILASSLSPVSQVAMVHTTFNLSAGIIALCLMPVFWPRVEDWIIGP